MMSIILNALISHLVPFLEDEFVKYEPALQSALFNDVNALSQKLEAWIKTKEHMKGK